MTSGRADKKHMQSHGWKLACLSHWPWLRQLWSRAIREIMCLADQLNACIKWPTKMGSHQGLKNTGNRKPNQPGNSRAEGWGGKCQLGILFSWDEGQMEFSVFRTRVLWSDCTANHQNTVKLGKERNTINLSEKKKRNIREVLWSRDRLTLELRDSFQNVHALELQKLKFYRFQMVKSWLQSEMGIVLDWLLCKERPRVVKEKTKPHDFD